MEKLAIITARGGSKRIPGKNLKDFLGKPIIAYSIETALLSGLFSEVMVSTDDDEIADISLKHGARVPFRRSQKNSDDFATTQDVLSEVINEYETRGKTFDMACCIYPTAPLLEESTLIEAAEILSNGEFDVVFPVVQYGFPIQRSMVKDENGLISYAYPENALTRSQDLRPHYHDSGQFYFFKIKSFLANNILMQGRLYGLEVNELSVQDIDNESDWKMAELKYQMLHQ